MNESIGFGYGSNVLNEVKTKTLVFRSHLALKLSS